jgi:CheY-like chemotaxis protein
MPPKRILLIEDEATTRELLTHVLRGEAACLPHFTDTIA